MDELSSGRPLLRAVVENGPDCAKRDVSEDAGEGGGESAPLWNSPPAGTSDPSSRVICRRQTSISFTSLATKEELTSLTKMASSSFACGSV